jgi:hypothetical protein
MKKYTCPNCGSYRLVDDQIISCDVGCRVGGYHVEYTDRTPVTLYPDQVLKSKDNKKNLHMKPLQKLNLTGGEPSIFFFNIQIKLNEIIDRVNELGQVSTYTTTTDGKITPGIITQKYDTTPNRFIATYISHADKNHLVFQSETEAQAALEALLNL